MTEYSHFAHVYDAFMEDAPYDAWIEFTKEIFSKYDYSPKSIIDLGCGTGEISVRLAEEGFSVTGVDMSQDMLTIADRKSQDKSLPITWIHQDLRTLSGIKQMDIAVSYCDVINYITEKDEVEQTMQNIYDCLRPGGMFIFDVHGMDYVQNHLIEHAFSDVDEQMAYIWNCFGGDVAGEMFHELTFFIENSQGYLRFDEDHHQRTYGTSFYKQILASAGFSNIQIFNDFSIENQNSDEIGERIFFIAQKQSR